MANQHQSESTLTLRAITYRISSTPTKQLPQIVHQISASLWNCKSLLSAPSQPAKTNVESSTLVHRFRTTLSSLLQDRTVEGRFSGVVLVKATIEAGGLETLNKSGPWLKSLLAILKKPDPPTVRALTVITLTRIFNLTWEYANLVREITTPNLPAFVTSCLNNAENWHRCSAHELETILEAFAALLPRHPTIFRSHEGSIRSLLLKILSAGSSNATSQEHYTQKHNLIARQLFVLLHHCAPKQAAGEKWHDTIQATLSAAHTTCDALFRSITENRSSITHHVGSSASPSTGQVGVDAEDALGLLPWSGIFAGAERVKMILEVLEQYLQTSTAGAVAVPIGQMADLMVRLFSVVPPISGNPASIKINPQIPKDERDLLYAVLPDVHAAAVNLMGAMINRFGSSVVSIVQPLLDRIRDVFVGEKAHENVRMATYAMLCEAVELIGPSMIKDGVAELGPIMKSCCDDLLTYEANSAPTVAAGANGAATKQTHNADAARSSAHHIGGYTAQLGELRRTAQSLLVKILSRIDSAYMPRKLRAQMERVAILSKDHDALVACVLNPAKNPSGTAAQASLLPLLVQLFPRSSEVEALLRPRLPSVLPRSQADELNQELSDDEELVNGSPGIGNTDSGEQLSGSEMSEGDGLLQEQNRNMNAKAKNITADTEDLYSASPRPSPNSESILQGSPSLFDTLTSNDPAIKRHAVSPPDKPLTTKRQRVEPTPDVSAGRSLDSASSEIETTSTEIVNAAYLPQIAPLDQTEYIDGHSAVAVVGSKPTSFKEASSFVNTMQNADEDSDIEVPPLTMDSDTDPDEDYDE